MEPAKPNPPPKRKESTIEDQPTQAKKVKTDAPPVEAAVAAAVDPPRPPNPPLPAAEGDDIMKPKGTRWSDGEDEILKSAVAQHGQKNWKAIAALVAGRDHVVRPCLALLWTPVIVAASHGFMSTKNTRTPTFPFNCFRYQ